MKLKTPFPGAFLAVSLLLSLFLAACGGSTQNSNVQEPPSGTVSAQQTAHMTPSPFVSPTQNAESQPTNCPTVPSGSTVITNFTTGTSGFQSEEHSDANGKVVNLSTVALPCGSLLKIHTTLSGDPNSEDVLHHTVLTDSQIPQHDFSGQWQFGCYTYFPSTIAASDGSGYYLRPSAVSAGYANDVSGDHLGTETLVSQNANSWRYSFVNVEKGGDADGSFDPSKIIAFTIGVTANTFANAWEGDFYIGSCLLTHGWHAPSDPLNMPTSA